jgi:hypothetical protein
MAKLAVEDENEFVMSRMHWASNILSKILMPFAFHLMKHASPCLSHNRGGNIGDLLQPDGSPALSVVGLRSVSANLEVSGMRPYLSTICDERWAWLRWRMKLICQIGPN